MQTEIFSIYYMWSLPDFPCNVSLKTQLFPNLASTWQCTFGSTVISFDKITPHPRQKKLIPTKAWYCMIPIHVRFFFLSSSPKIGYDFFFLKNCWAHCNVLTTIATNVQMALVKFDSWQIVHAWNVYWCKTVLKIACVSYSRMRANDMQISLWNVSRFYHLVTKLSFPRQVGRNSC